MVSYHRKEVSYLKNVSDTIKIVVTANQMKVLRDIDAEDYRPVVRLAEKDFRDRKVRAPNPDDAIYALKQYYVLAALNPKNLHAVSDVVDPYWHAHILHTRRYERFCREVTGYFMHHEPLDHEEVQAVKDVSDLYGYTLEILQVFFAGNVDHAFWPTNPGAARMVCVHYERHPSGDPSEDDNVLPPDPRLAGVRVRALV